MCMPIWMDAYIVIESFLVPIQFVRVCMCVYVCVCVCSRDDRCMCMCAFREGLFVLFVIERGHTLSYSTVRVCICACVCMVYGCICAYGCGCECVGVWVYRYVWCVYAYMLCVDPYSTWREGHTLCFVSLTYITSFVP